MTPERTGGRPAPSGPPPPEAFGAALAALPGMGPARLAAVLAEWAPAEAWERILAGSAWRAPAVAGACRPDPRGVAAAWRERAGRVDVPAGFEALRAAGMQVHLLGGPGYPAVLAGDHEAPAVLFSRGDPAAVDGPRVALVGTRRASAYGRAVAHELGRDLAAAGVRVVSGLALGIDGAAHAGALASGPGAGPPVGVVGSGIDVVYPGRHARLWHEVGRRGILMSEAAPGARPERWRFPVRNRIVAALAEVVVVVESPHAGGSRHTVDAAAARGRPVMAVPGPVRSPGSELPNALLADGCHPARDAVDVLVALGLGRPGRGGLRPGDVGRGEEIRPPPGPAEAAVLDALGWERSSFEQVVVASGLVPAAAGLALAHLERDGWVAGDAGWWERCGPDRAHRHHPPDR